MELELNLVSLWKMLKKRLWLVATLSLGLTLIVGLVSYFVLKPQYEATATILVQNQKSNQQMVYTDVMTNQQLVKTYSDIIKSKRIADDVIKKLSLNISENDLLAKVKVQTATQSLVTSITITDGNPKLAVSLANAFAESFDQNINQIMKVDNVSILDSAKLQDSLKPVSPRPTLNMAVAFVVGLLVSVGTIILLETLDKTIKTEEEVMALLDLPVLGVIAKADEDTKKPRNMTKSLENRGATIEG